ncbi:fused toxin protein-like [Crassostrea angulata]|uniref:fused toxin protein-like n=1 Tax=Magallana angulata TaxID=2784310 RepID=UPI0022B144DB|nr:fused toxin protein-like [Crassostrea angulata]
MNRPIQTPELKNPACGLLPETGECRALARRYAFNKTLNACEEFNYGGCDGNANNFQYKDLCEYVCQYNRPCSKIGCFEKACTTQTCPNHPDAKCFAVCLCESRWILDGADVTSTCEDDVEMIPERRQAKQ